MALYRQVQCDFWSDPKVMEWTPDERYFYLYLLTNEKTRQCGIYEIAIKQIILDTGYSRDLVDTLIERFENKYQRIKYNRETCEMAIRNWIKYNFSTSPKILTCIRRELDTVKDKVLIQYVYPIDTLSILYRNKNKNITEEEQEHKVSMYVAEGEPEKIEEEPVDNVDTVDNSQDDDGIAYDLRIARIAQTYEKVFCRIMTPMHREKLLAFLDEGIDVEVILMALVITSNKNKDGLDYTLGILRKWAAQGVRTKEQAEEAKKRYEMQQTANQRNGPGQPKGKGQAVFDAMAKMQSEDF